MKKFLFFFLCLIIPTVTYASSAGDYASALLIIFSMVFGVLLVILIIVLGFFLKRTDFTSKQNILLRILFSINLLLISVSGLLLSMFFGAPVLLYFFDISMYDMNIFLLIEFIIFPVFIGPPLLHKTKSAENPFRLHIFILILGIICSIFLLSIINSQWILLIPILFGLIVIIFRNSSINVKMFIFMKKLFLPLRSKFISATRISTQSSDEV